MPNETITQTFVAGTIRATYTGSFATPNGDGTAYFRLKVQPAGGTAYYVGDSTVSRSSVPAIENATYSFSSQAVITVSAGEYSITPQVYINNPSWGLYYQNNFVVEQ